MRAPDRDQRGSAVPLICTALVILLAVIPAGGALASEYEVFPNGTACRAAIDVTDTDRYTFADTGFMGEEVPVTVGEVEVSENTTPISFNWSRPWGAPASVSFAKGNYTISFIAPIRDNTVRAVFTKPYNVTVTLPQEFRVDNLLLAGLSTGANVTRAADNTTTVRWERVYSFDLRFYSKGQEDLLFFFLQFMGILIVVLVVIPYLLSMRGDG